MPKIGEAELTDDSLASGALSSVSVVKKVRFPEKSTELVQIREIQPTPPPRYTLELILGTLDADMHRCNTLDDMGIERSGMLFDSFDPVFVIELLQLFLMPILKVNPDYVVAEHLRVRKDSLRIGRSKLLHYYAWVSSDLVEQLFVETFSLDSITELTHGDRPGLLATFVLPIAHEEIAEWLEIAPSEYFRNLNDIRQYERNFKKEASEVETALFWAEYRRNRRSPTCGGGCCTIC